MALALVLVGVSASRVKSISARIVSFLFLLVKYVQTDIYREHIYLYERTGFIYSLAEIRFDIRGRRYVNKRTLHAPLSSESRCSEGQPVGAMSTTETTETTFDVHQLCFRRI